MRAVMPCLAWVIVATIAGCALGHEPDPTDDGGEIDAARDGALSDGGLAPTCGDASGPCCYGNDCTTSADCTDPVSPFCVPYFTRNRCAASRAFPCGPTCASPDTMIATPSGERAIADLVVGDLVYSQDGIGMVAVPIAEISRTPVVDHRVVRVTLATGRVLEISPGHPTADGRWFGDLRAGDRLDGTLVLDAELIPYLYAFTYDVLPASDTGTYVAGGALIGSTLTE